MGEKDFEADLHIGDFRIIKRLGAGGMGVVYQARQTSLDRAVALKVLGSALSRPSDLFRFMREAQATAKLNHPGIAQVYLTEQDGTICYMAMEFIDGITVRDLIERISRTHNPDLSIDAVLQEGPRVENRAPTIRFDAPGRTVEDSLPETDEANKESDHKLQWSTREAQQLIESKRYIHRVCEIVRDTALALSHAHANGVIHRDIKPTNIICKMVGPPDGR